LVYPPIKNGVIKQTLTVGPLKESQTSETDDMKDSGVE
jgi:hypothetical protein